ncbi:MAG TPA: hypothetical protein VN862_03380 [Candidatus Acidoferrales bacterium]|nr:hypothetical protein [Candidatus Acidoferrales bacterium]
MKAEQKLRKDVQTQIKVIEKRAGTLEQEATRQGKQPVGEMLKEEARSLRKIAKALKGNAGSRGGSSRKRTSSKPGRRSSQAA